MCRITIDEFEKNFDYYLEKCKKEDIYIIYEKGKETVLMGAESYTKLHPDFCKTKKPL